MISLVCYNRDSLNTRHVGNYSDIKVEWQKVLADGRCLMIQRHDGEWQVTDDVMDASLRGTRWQAFSIAEL